MIGNEAAYNTWKAEGGTGYVAPTNAHTLSKVDGQAATCAGAGYANAWKCSECNKYYSDDQAQNLIGDEATYNTWKAEGGTGYVAPTNAHTLNKVDGQEATCAEAGYADAWKCSTCNKYYSDDQAQNLIGDETTYNTWKVEGGTGYVAPTNAHTYGDLIARVENHRATDGMEAHYECSVCHKLFDSNKAEKTANELKIASKVVTYTPPTTGNTFAEFSNLGGISGKIWIDIYFDNPSVHQEVGFNFYVDAWKNYYGTFWVDCDSSGVYFEGDYEGLTLEELDDGWWRVTAYTPVLSKYVNDYSDIAKSDKIDFIWIKAPGTVSNRGSGKFEFMPDYGTPVPSTTVYSLNGKNSFTTKRAFMNDEKFAIDVKFISGTVIKLDMMQGWSSVLRLEINSNGTIEYQKNGVQIFKLTNEKEGYPTLDGQWYRIVVDLKYITPSVADYKCINRIGGNQWNEAQFDMMINSPYETDGWYDFAGGSSNTKINLVASTPVTIRDSEGALIPNKKFAIKVKATGTGTVKFSIEDYNWNNCANLVLSFTDGALTEAKIVGSPNKWATIVDLGDGTYSVVIPFEKMTANGFASAYSIGLFNGEGLIANGVTSFSMNLLDIGLVD